MTAGSRFIAAAVAALGVSLASAGFLAARRSYSAPPAGSPSVVAEATPTVEPTPAAAPLPVASPEVEPADQPLPAPARASGTVLTRAVSPKPSAPTATKARTPAVAPAREVAAARPATTTIPVQHPPSPVLDPVLEAPASRPSVPKPTVESVPTPPPAPAVATAPVEKPRPQFEDHTVKADSVLGIRLGQSLSSATARLEDRVTASVSRDVVVDGRTVVPAGTRLEGDVTLVEPGSKFKGRARLGIRFHTIVLADGLRVPIQTDALYRDGESATGASVKKVGTGAAAGAILGAVLGGKKGAIIGAGVGAGGGTAAVLAGDTKDALLERGTPLTMRLTSPVRITIERDPSIR